MIFGRRRPALPALLYHHVGEPNPKSWRHLTVRPEQFEAQIGALRDRGYHGIRASDWIASAQREGTLPDRPILITFDDAYRDIAEYALPVLERCGFGAVVLVVTGEIGGRSAWDEKMGFATLPLMSAGELVAWSARGIEMGAHSKTHFDLRAVAREVLEVEVAGSKRALQDLIGRPVNAFAYPYGLYDATVRRAVRAEYAIAFTTRSGLNEAGDPLDRVRRTTVLPSDTIADVLVRARLGWNPADLLRRGVDSGLRVLDRAG